MLWIELEVSEIESADDEVDGFVTRTLMRPFNCLLLYITFSSSGLRSLVSGKFSSFNPIHSNIVLHHVQNEKYKPHLLGQLPPFWPGMLGAAILSAT